MDTKFTRGPWKACIDGPVVVIVRDGIVAECKTNTDDMGSASGHAPVREIAEANALLIAAAPDLYEALRECRDQLALLAKDPRDNWWVKTATAALAKATP